MALALFLFGFYKEISSDFANVTIKFMERKKQEYNVSSSNNVIVLIIALKTLMSTI